MGLLFVAAAGLAWRAIRLKHRLEWSERDRRRAADELNRRLSELFSLQELSYILSGSLQLERIVEQVVRYTMRFLDARGALLALALDGEGGGGAGRGMLQGAAAGGAPARWARGARGAGAGGCGGRARAGSPGRAGAWRRGVACAPPIAGSPRCSASRSPA